MIREQIIITMIVKLIKNTIMKMVIKTMNKIIRWMMMIISKTNP